MARYLGVLVLLAAVIACTQASDLSSVESPALIAAKRQASLEIERNGFETIGGKQYYIGRSIMLGWWDALKLCESFRLRLVTLDTEEKYNTMYTYLFLDGSDPGFYWVSGVRVGGRYVWSAVGDELSFVHWAELEPTESFGDECLGLWVKQTDGMHDNFCWRTSRYICEEPCIPATLDTTLQ